MLYFYNPQGAIMARDPETWTGDKAELYRCQDASLKELAQYIVERYHQEAKVELARLEALADEAALLAGSAEPTLETIRNEVERFGAELRAHLRHEERTVFPALLQMEEGDPVPAPLRDPLRLLEDEHAAAAGLLRRIHDLTHGYVAPPAAHEAHRRLFETFQHLADSLRRHIYLENQVLFKRALHRQA
jgi:regulator of cell morphogenesis and NO signaling